MDYVSRRTPYNDEYQSCMETRVRLSIYSEEKDYQHITTLMQIEPTHFCIKNRELVNNRGFRRIEKTHAWFLESEHFVSSKDSRRHFDWLINKITPASDAICSLQKEQGIKMSVDCIWYSRGSGGPVLWPEQMKALADMNLECGFDIYFFDPTIS